MSNFEPENPKLPRLYHHHIMSLPSQFFETDYQFYEFYYNFFQKIPKKVTHYTWVKDRLAENGNKKLTLKFLYIIKLYLEDGKIPNPTDVDKKVNSHSNFNF